MTYPSVRGVNLMPNSTALASSTAGCFGTRWPKRVFGPVSCSSRVAGVPMLALSSMARTRTTWVLRPAAWKLYDQEVVPVAGCQLVPSSVETSTPATRPPTSLAVPVIVT